jgi:hypothetical protein
MAHWVAPPSGERLQRYSLQGERNRERKSSLTTGANLVRPQQMSGYSCILLTMLVVENPSTVGTISTRPPLACTISWPTTLAMV